MSGDGDDKGARRDRLIECASAAIAAGGLGALKARPLADCAGCSVGGIYNLVSDLDDLVLRVNARTLDALDECLDAAAALEGDVESRLVAWAQAYVGFAKAHRNLWRALFEFRMSEVADALPDWFAADQSRLFARLEAAVGILMPGAREDLVRLRARTLFSAVHGIVALGLEGKLAALPVRSAEDEVVAFIRIFVAGLIQQT